MAELLTTNKLSELACLTLYLMYEKKNGRQSVWFEFIQVSLCSSTEPSICTRLLPLPTTVACGILNTVSYDAPGSVCWAP